MPETADLHRTNVGGSCNFKGMGCRCGTAGASASYPRHQLCRAPEPHDSHGDSPLHQADECLFKEAGQSQGRLCSALRVLQLLSNTQELVRHACDGSRHSRSRLGFARTAVLMPKSLLSRTSRLLPDRRASARLWRFRLNWLESLAASSASCSWLSVALIPFRSGLRFIIELST